MKADTADAWVKVRTEFLARLTAGLGEARERSLWYVDGMDDGDVSEFGTMMENFESVLGVPEHRRMNWNDQIHDMEGA